MKDMRITGSMEKIVNINYYPFNNQIVICNFVIRIHPDPNSIYLCDWTIRYQFSDYNGNPYDGGSQSAGNYRLDNAFALMADQLTNHLITCGFISAYDDQPLIKTYQNHFNNDLKEKVMQAYNNGVL